ADDRPAARRRPHQDPLNLLRSASLLVSRTPSGVIVFNSGTAGSGGGAAVVDHRSRDRRGAQVHGSSPQRPLSSRTLAAVARRYTENWPRWWTWSSSTNQRKSSFRKSPRVFGATMNRTVSSRLASSTLPRVSMTSRCDFSTPSASSAIVAGGLSGEEGFD